MSVIEQVKDEVRSPNRDAGLRLSVVGHEATSHCRRRCRRPCLKVLHSAPRCCQDSTSITASFPVRSILLPGYQRSNIQRSVLNTSNDCKTGGNKSALERQCPSRIAVCLLRWYTVHSVSFDHTIASTTAAKTPVIRRVLRQWGLCWRCCDDLDLPSGPTSDSFCRTGKPESLRWLDPFGTGYLSTRGSSRVLSRIECGDWANCAVHGPFLHQLRVFSSGAGITTAFRQWGR